MDSPELISSISMTLCGVRELNNDTGYLQYVTDKVDIW